MLFNSYYFIFLFLPIVLAVYFLLLRKDTEYPIVWLVFASLFFYGWWNPVYLFLIIASMVINYALGWSLSDGSGMTPINRKRILVFGIALNLSALGYYKYAGFFIENIKTLITNDFSFEEILLPLAISFFTFQQIAYLVDAYRGITKEYRFIHYALFVTFFPQLIAGPIVHHKEMLPQFLRVTSFKKNIENFSIGITIFTIGLFKKSVLADNVAQYSTPVFDAAATGDSLSFFVAWGGAMAYTMQLYFDFSGYSDMAIGGARLFGIKLPLNFHSPYKATTIVEFWRRWHMTLSRFLRDYLYIPLGGNQCGTRRRYLNLSLTMVLGGLWHGAGWTFVVWGALHGFYLIVNHAWNNAKRLIGISQGSQSKLGKALAWTITFLSVVLGWVFFRAQDFNSAIRMLEGMVGLNGFQLPNAIISRLGSFGVLLQEIGIGTYLGGGSVFVLTYIWVFLLMFVALFLPNTQQLLAQYHPALVLYNHGESNKYSINVGIPLSWKPTTSWAIIIALLGTFGVLALTSVSEFLYFQF
ncbi:MAG: MBOAT family protein [Sedimenticola sp.]|nr:MBOAT family protein [Sedimenticola sp.]MCW8947867.1 MBOAT family protein [Sedimenticola sp.]MCW8950180.1 MBOAT family protein [Sedimenticola sp.]MCW8974511.1 MBOAT family protein [Sedimenticola sp.]